MKNQILHLCMTIVVHAPFEGVAAFDHFNPVFVGCGAWSSTMLARKIDRRDRNDAFRAKLEEMAAVKKRKVKNYQELPKTANTKHPIPGNLGRLGSAS